jgi:hypothetical protein
MSEYDQENNNSDAWGTEGSKEAVSLVSSSLPTHRSGRKS